MSSEEIKVGDVVYVAKPTLCCGSAAGVGAVFTVTDILMDFRGRCQLCGHVFNPPLAIMQGDNHKFYHARQLKKIKPLGDENEINEIRSTKITDPVPCR